MMALGGTCFGSMCRHQTYMVYSTGAHIATRVRTINVLLVGTQFLFLVLYDKLTVR